MRSRSNEVLRVGELVIRCSESVLCLILLCGVGASCLVVAVLVLRWLLMFLHIVMGTAVELYLICCTLFCSWIGAVGRAIEVMEMRGEEDILEEVLNDGLLLVDENGDSVWQNAVVDEHGEADAVEDSEWLKWWVIGCARQENKELWRRVWWYMDEVDMENFSDTMDFYGELLWNVEELGDEFLMGGMLG